MFFTVLAKDLPKAGTKVYSFGKVEVVNKDGSYSVIFKENRISIKTYLHLSIGSWIRFIGESNGHLVHCTFCEVIDGVDTHLLVRGLDKLSSN